MTYSEKIKEIRKSKKMTLREFGSLVGYDFTYIGLLERGISKAGSSKRLNPSIGVLKDICDRSGYDFRKFLEETEYLSPAASYDVTAEEFSILEKLRTLSPAEKQTVLQVLEMSYETHQKSATPAEKRA